MTEIIFAILVISLLLYVLLGGADFGGGILELLTKGKASGIVSKAIAPVWEANHMWLILVVVILFVGFPDVYTTILTALHIPVLLTLIGIILRGSAFTFRHYDIEEESAQSHLFVHIPVFKPDDYFFPWRDTLAGLFWATSQPTTPRGSTGLLFTLVQPVLF